MNKQELNPEFIGNQLLKRGFADWFRYMFRVIEGTKFVIEPLHKGLIDVFQRVYNGDLKRLIINVPPRAGKTTLAKYLTIYAITINPRSNIIYTSFSQELLSDISNSVKEILTSPIYRAMYPLNVEYFEDIDKPVDEFWLEYVKRTYGKEYYSAKKIVTSQGGLIVFSSIGGQITGRGAGLRNSKKFGGMVIIDDPNKPADIYSEKLRKKVLNYYEETILNRLNNSDVPIIEIQQRLHQEDLTGLLLQRYPEYEVLKKPLVDSEGNCTLPNQFTPKRIKELQVNNYVFQAQFQQDPIAAGGNVIKREWFKYYDISQEYKYKRIVMASDTAMSTKESADRSVVVVGGVTQNNQLHIIDFIAGRWDYPTLKQKIIALWNKWQFDRFHTSASGLYVEDKASGIQIIQELSKHGIPVRPLKADKDKLTRVESVLDYIASGQVFLPDNENYGFNPDILNELESFTRDNSHLHDDVTDSIVWLITATIAHKQVSILEVL